MKDRFSSHSQDYAQFRPGYPPELFAYLRKMVSNRGRAWDCGTGSGQVAGELAGFFREVMATDISVQQLSRAVQKPNIHYTKQPAEKTIFPDDHFDLVTVAQAIHWFDFERFYEEVNRVLKPGGLLAVIGYSLFRSNEETDQVIQLFYEEVVGPYWDEERKYLEENYKSIPFPLREMETPQFELRQEWSLDRVIGYLNTWSAVKSYEKAKGESPVDLIKAKLEKSFGHRNEIVFPILFRLGENVK